MEQLHKYRGVEQQAEEDGEETRVIRAWYGADGAWVELEGHEQPYKGIADPHAVEAAGVVKKILQGRLVDAAWLCMQPYILEEGYMTPMARELCRSFDGRLGIVIAHVLEYDAAYRFRVQDLAGETTKTELLLHPVRTIVRLVKISRQRDYPEVHKKMRMVLWITCGLLFMQWFRNRVARLDWARLCLDENDAYWLAQRTDYRWPYVV